MDPGSFGPRYGDEEVRTIFVTGFPADTKERELQNLLRWWPGYEACQLTRKDSEKEPGVTQTMGFALFSTPALAIAARDALQGLVFDTDTNSTLRTEMAKKNLFKKKGIVSTPPSLDVAYDPNKRMRTMAAAAPMSADPNAYLRFGAPAYDSLGGGMAMTSPNLIPLGVGVGVGAPPSYSTLGASMAARERSKFGDEKDNPPCNTLFVGNLGPTVNEAELHAIFGSQPGFRQMKLLRQPHGAVCFIEYVDTDTATAVHSSLQGLVLVSCPERGALRLQYSKNPFGRKRDGTFHPHSAAAAAAGTEEAIAADSSDAAAAAAAENASAAASGSAGNGAASTEPSAADKE